MLKPKTFLWFHATNMVIFSTATWLLFHAQPKPMFHATILILFPASTLVRLYDTKLLEFQAVTYILLNVLKLLKSFTKPQDFPSTQPSKEGLPSHTSAYLWYWIVVANG